MMCGFLFCFFIERDDDVEEIFEIGREFDERYHWHTLKPLTDDYDRTKQNITGDEKK